MTLAGKKLIPGLGTLVKIQPDEVSFQIEHQADSTATTLPELVADFKQAIRKASRSRYYEEAIVHNYFRRIASMLILNITNVQ